eukprot:959042-Prorocentrum_lima.AAC.1
MRRCTPAHLLSHVLCVHPNRALNVCHSAVYVGPYETYWIVWGVDIVGRGLGLVSGVVAVSGLCGVCV